MNGLSVKEINDCNKFLKHNVFLHIYITTKIQ